MIPKPSIHPLAHRHIRELRERWGVEPTLEEALWIVELCKRVLNPNAGERLDLIGIPARCGASDEWLWPITIGAGIWYQDLAEAWWPGDVDRLNQAMAFALAHARDKETLRACRTRDVSAGMIREWALSLTCNQAELNAAVDEILPPKGYVKPGAVQTGKTDWEALVREIELVSGIGADHWLWEVSREATLRAWFQARQVLAAQGGRGAPSGTSPEDEAVQDLATAKKAIIDAHAAPPPNAPIALNPLPQAKS